MIHLAGKAIYCLPGHFFYKFCNIVKIGFRARKPDNLSIKPDLADSRERALELDECNVHCDTFP